MAFHLGELSPRKSGRYLQPPAHFPLGFSNKGQQRNSVEFLRHLVYTASRIGAENFIRVIFTSSAGRIVFEAYQNEDCLPEHVADANGHKMIAAYLRRITERYKLANRAMTIRLGIEDDDEN